jgi:hypothetical protein
VSVNYNRSLSSSPAISILMKRAERVFLHATYRDCNALRERDLLAAETYQLS